MRIMFLGLLLLAGCEAGIVTGGESPAAGDQLTVRSIELVGTSRETCSVEINSQPDRDGVDDSHWRATLALDGASAPLDEGGKLSTVSYVTAVRQRDAAPLRHRVSFTLYESTR